MHYFDKFISVFSPRVAAERAYYRSLYDSYEKGYDAGDNSRLNAAWRVFNASAESINTFSRDTIRARARDLERNSDIANALLSAFKRNIIGRGYALQAKTIDGKLNDRIESLWRQWTRKQNCDVTESQNFTQMMRMCLTRKLIDGGIIIRKCFDGEGEIPFRLQLIDVDELDLTVMSPNFKGNRVVSGIEVEPSGKTAGYWITRYSNDGYKLENPKFYPAKDIIYYASKSRPSQVREISPLAPVLMRIRDVNEFITAVSVKERIAACLSVFIKKTPPVAGMGRNNGDMTKIDYAGKKLSPGMMMEMNAGDSIEVVDPKSGGDNAASFLNVEQKLISAGQGISYEAMSRDMSGVNYSSARQANIEDELTFAEEIESLCDMMTEIYETFVISAELKGLLGVPDFWAKKREYLKHSWVAPAKKWIDPVKEANANKTALETYQTSLKQVAAERGLDWKVLVDDIADVNNYIDEKIKKEESKSEK